jgi:flagellar biosynthetic protein FliQ
MTADGTIDTIRNAFLVALQVAGPALMATLVIGLLVGVFQASTQVNEPSVTFLAKLVGVGVVLSVAGPFMIAQLVEYARQSIGSIAHMIR